MSCKDSKHEFSLQLIDKIEKFKRDNGVLPTETKQISIKEREDSPAYYKKIADSTYIIWYGLSLGESRTYYSDKKIWLEW